jgi:type IV pilus assembly protein PilP
MKRHFLYGAMVAGMFLTACSGQDEEMQAWLDAQAKEVHPNVAPILPPRKFQPEPYAGAGGAEPFATAKMVVGTRLDPKGSGAMVASEMQRRKQPLEAFPLDSMKMVGSVMKNGAANALIRVDNLLHYVKVGEYLGQNFGKIVKISESGIDLREIVQDASGEWVERMSTLQLQEAGQ